MTTGEVKAVEGAIVHASQLINSLRSSPEERALRALLDAVKLLARATTGART